MDRVARIPTHRSFPDFHWSRTCSMGVIQLKRCPLPVNIVGGRHIDSGYL